jgi:hypothetical protein
LKFCPYFSAVNVGAVRGIKTIHIRHKKCAVNRNSLFFVPPIQDHSDFQLERANPTYTANRW